MKDRLSGLISLLHRHGTASAAEIGAALGVSQPTVSRLLAAAGGSVVRFGKARATRYALSRTVARAGSQWPLYRITALGRAELLGHLHALHGGYLFASTAARPAFLHGQFRSGLFPGLPWFLDDQRPQGFLGRAFARRVAESIGASSDLTVWQADDIVLALLLHGEDAPGDLILGEPSLQRALRQIVQTGGLIPSVERERAYPLHAELALRGEDIGSSAGGEQPKFTAILDDAGCHRAVIVKFSERAGTAAAQRWADLLYCEHLANLTLNDHGLPAAHNQIVVADGRVFLQSTRFDRTAERGRRGFISLAALDAACYGHGRIDWWQFAPTLARDGWLTSEDARRLALYGWFGALIANSDMHLGNAGLILTDARPLALAPAYDMLPMAFRPATNGEVIERRYALPLPTPELRDLWHEAVVVALNFWERVAQCAMISDGFCLIATDALDQLHRARTRIG
ncbi:MAG: type II toxin-antitoxin system HipA family toxin YjjJ [Nevskiaceae bacterium]|nr:type II toxin-antitoxin system HipA family toxin YjjJ [Nevskiaceae bacterium]